MTARIVEIRQGVLNKNDALAVELRPRFEASGVTVINLVSALAPARPRFWNAPADLLASGRGPPPSWATWRPKTTINGWHAGAPVRQIVTAGMLPSGGRHGPVPPVSTAGTWQRF